MPASVSPRLVIPACLMPLATLLLVNCSEGGSAPTDPLPEPTIAITLDASTVSLTEGGQGNVAINRSRSGGYTGGIELSLKGAPEGLAGGFAPASISGTSSASTPTRGLRHGHRRGGGQSGAGKLSADDPRQRGGRAGHHIPGFSHPSR